MMLKSLAEKGGKVLDIIKHLKEEKNINFTDEQKKAVNHVYGPNLTLAVPGAGKTTCLMARTANLIFNHGIDPKSILTVTFSKASALDMQHRFAEIFGDVGENIRSVKFSTIHSFAYRIVNHVYQDKILIEDMRSPITKSRLIKNIYKELTGEYMEEDKLEEISNSISYAKNKMVDINSLNKEELLELCSFKEFKDIYLKYEKMKEKDNYIDYDDMLTLCYEKMANDKRYLNLLRNHFQFIQIDESQDTSTVQFAIVELLARPMNNILFLGDINQGIMSFRASDIRYLLNFKKKFPSGSIYTMSRNFRSTKDIVDVANKFVKKNIERYDFEMFTEKGSDRPINIVYVDTEKKELDYIIGKLKKATNLGENAVLFRNNISCIPLVDKLSKEKIPFYMKDHGKRFFSHWLISDIKAFINLAIDNNDFNSLYRIYYKSNLYISKQLIMDSRNYTTDKGCLDALEKMESLRDDQLDRVRKFTMNMRCLSKAKGREIAKIIRKDLRYEDFIINNSEAMGYSQDSLLNLISIFSLITADSSSLLDVLKRLDYLEKLIKASSKNKNQNVVTLTTIHGSKGLEWENVYIMNMIDSIFPSSQATKLESKGDNSLMEEERRICYVGITRGKRYVDLVIPRSIAGKEVYPSKFIWEIEKIIRIDKGDKSYEDSIRRKKGNRFNLGDIVKHSKFGKGKIVDINQKDDYLVINFYDSGIKKLVLSLAVAGLLSKVCK